MQNLQIKKVRVKDGKQLHIGKNHIYIYIYIKVINCDNNIILKTYSAMEEVASRLGPPVDTGFL